MARETEQPYVTGGAIRLPEPEMLALARDWKAGRLWAVHPEIGRMFNNALTRVGEQAVPFRRATNPRAPSLADLIRAEYARASSVHEAGGKAA